MTISDAAEKLQLSPQLLRVWIQHEGTKHPFGVILQNKTRRTYYINEDKLKAWVEGRV